MLDFNIKFDDKSVQYCHRQKILGVHIDENLVWSTHASYVESRLSSLLGLLYILRPFVTKYVMLMFYKCYILPVIDYCLNVWGHITNIHMNRLQVLQNRAGGIILGVDYSTRTIDIHAELRWMTVKQRLFHQTSILMYKVLRGNAPDYSKNIEVCIS